MICIWTEFFFASHHICSAHKLPGVSWNGHGEISSGPDTLLHPTKALAINNAGDAIAVWEEHKGAHCEVHCARFISGAWESPRCVSTMNGKNADHPAVELRCSRQLCHRLEPTRYYPIQKYR